MRYQVTTPLTPREALEQALADFGPGGLGLQLTSQTNLSLVLQGGGGHIAVTAEPGAKTTLDIETREWDYGVEPLTAVIDQKLRLREDEVNDGNIRDEVLANAPEAQHGFFAVPKVIE